MKASSGGTLTPITPVKAGLHRAVCVDVVDLGMVTSTFNGETKQQHKVQLRFQLDARINQPDVPFHGQRYVVSKRFTLSFHKQSNLRPFVSDWMNQLFADDAELELDDLIGRPAQLLIKHRTGSDGNTYSDIQAITPDESPETMVAEDYIRVQDRNAAVAAENDDDIPF